MKDKNKAVLLLILAAILWGYSFIATSKLVNGGVDNEVALIIRYALGAVCIFLMAPKKILKATRYDVIAGMIIGGLLFLAMYSQNASMLYTSVSKSAFLSSLCIILVPFFAYFILKNRVTKKNFIGLVIALIGTILLSFNPRDFTSVNFGDMLSIFCAFVFAFQTIVLSIVSKKASAFAMAFFQMVSVTVCGIVMAFVNGANFEHVLEPDMIKSLLYLGIVASGIAYTCLNLGAKHVDEILLSIIPSSQSLFAVIFDVVIFHTALGINAIAGIVIMTFALIYFALANEQGVIKLANLKSLNK